MRKAGTCKQMPPITTPFAARVVGGAASVPGDAGSVAYGLTTRQSSKRFAGTPQHATAGNGSAGN